MNRLFDTFAAVRFIAEHMYRSVDTAEGDKLSAIPETAEPIGGDNWFWTDDNAKVLELLSRPEVWLRFPRQTADILQFVGSMCRGPFIFRRLAAPQLQAMETAGGIAGFRHAFMNVRHDPKHGAVAVGLRYHDERNIDSMLFFGNYVEFTYRRRKFKIPLDGGFEGEGLLDGNSLVLRHRQDVRFADRGREVRLGHLFYEYVFQSRSMLIDIQVQLEIDPGLEISDVVLTIGHDQLDTWHYAIIDTDSRNTAGPLYAATEPARTRLDIAAASYYVIRQASSSGDALALHNTPLRRGHASLEAITRKAGALHRVTTRYAFTGPHRGATLAAAESKLLTGGGLYERTGDYAAFMHDAIAGRTTARMVQDFSTSYDYGVVTNAFAKCFASSSGHSEIEADPAELRSSVDRYLRHFDEIVVAGHRKAANTAYSREVAFAVLAAVTMYKATQSSAYRDQVASLCEVLLDLERPFATASGGAASGFIMRVDAPPIAHVDCHSAAILALIRAAECIGGEPLAEAIDRGLEAYCLVTAAAEAGPRSPFDGIGATLIDQAGARHTETAFWNFKIGLTMRAFAALQHTADPALQRLAARHREQLELYDAIMRRQVQRSLKRHREAVEITTCVYAAETNSETQPWVTLGLVGHPCD
jgi:hypothetical protein